MAFIRINKRNFFHNLSQLALKAGSKDRIAVVLKDNAYGHGLEIMASLASEYGIREAVVISTDEARVVKEYFDKILILHGTPIMDDKFSFAITDIRQLDNIDPSASIELKVDTGMHRNGIMMDELSTALDTIKDLDLNLTGVMTHYRSADVLSSELAWQKKNFEKVKREVVDAGYSVRFHSHNSAALLRSKSFDEDIARVGIAIYGYNELPKIYDKVELKPILSLHAKRTSTRALKAGERVSYGGDFEASQDMTVSTYDIGYGDGWMRGDSQGPYITADGSSLLGRVSMDFVSIEGDADEVCIMNNAQQSAKHFKTISYEMTTMLSPYIERTIV